MLKIIEFLSKKRNLLAMLFAVFMFLRLFVNYDSILLAGDNLKYFEAAKNFPYHTLYNNQLYLLHLPLYPYVIHFFTLLFKHDYIAAILISLISAAITFFAVYHLFRILTNNFNLAFLVLVFFTLSDSFIVSAGAALRESFLVMLIVSSVYFYVKAMKFNDMKSIFLATAISGALALTSDHVVLIVPAIILSYIFFSKRKMNIMRLHFPNLSYVVLPLLLIFALYSSWALIKFYQYSNAEYYPNGFEGTPMNTRDLGLLQVISPQNFEDYEGTYIKPGMLSVLKRIVFNLGYMFNMEPFSIPQGLNFSTMEYLLFPRHVAYAFLIYLPLAVIALFGIMRIITGFIKSRRIYNNADLYIVGLFLIFVFPLTQKFASPRYILTSYIFFFYFISLGIVVILQKSYLNVRKVISVVAIMLLLMAPFWYYRHSNFVLSSEKVIASQNTGNFINKNIPRDAGIMVQPGYTVKLIYLTDNRIIGLHHNPEKLPYLIDYYNISYIVFGDFFTNVRGLSRNSVEYVKSRPDKFELIATVQENYSDFFVEGDLAREDKNYIYKVKKKNI